MAPQLCNHLLVKTTISVSHQQWINKYKYNGDLSGIFWINNVCNFHYFFGALSSMGMRDCISTEAVTKRCSVKNLFLKISQKLAENVC